MKLILGLTFNSSVIFFKENLKVLALREILLVDQSIVNITGIQFKQLTPFISNYGNL